MPAAPASTGTLDDSALSPDSPAAGSSKAGSAAGAPACNPAGATEAPSAKGLPPHSLEAGKQASAAVSWGSAEDSAACQPIDFERDFEEEDYGADDWRAPWRRHEGLTAGFILLSLLVAAVVNAGVGVANSRRATHAPGMHAVAVGAALLAPPLPPPAPPPPPPPPRVRKRRRPAREFAALGNTQTWHGLFLENRDFAGVGQMGQDWGVAP